VGEALVDENVFTLHTLIFFCFATPQLVTGREGSRDRAAKQLIFGDALMGESRRGSDNAYHAVQTL
jgi:hypothetical protein